MKRTTLYIFAVFALVVLFIASSAEASKLRKGDNLRINVSKTRLKSSPKPFGGKLLKTLDRGESVKFIGSKGSFHEVEYGGLKGFIPAKSLIRAKKFKSFSRTAKVTESDMAAATKGFSPEVEAKNRQNKELRYDLMDKAEKMSTVKYPLESLADFRKKGKLGEFQ